MSMDKSLKIHGGLAKARSVLKRPERIARLIEEEKFDPEKDSPLGLPKTKMRHSRAGSKTKKAEKESAVEAESLAEEQPTAEEQAES